MKVRNILKEKRELFIKNSINEFINKGIYQSKEEVIYAAIKSLIKDQIQKESKDRVKLFDEEFYKIQLNDSEPAPVEMKKNARKALFKGSKKIQHLKKAQELISEDFMSEGRDLKPIQKREEVTSENFGDKLLESANEALAHAKGEKELKTTELKLSDKNKSLEEAQKRIDNLPDNWFDGKPLLMEFKGSIVEAKEDIIAQGCNCSGASGAGIAKYIAQEYPESDRKYKGLCKNKKFHLGTVMFHKEKGKVQAFCGTQQYYGKYLKMDKKSIEKRYEAIEECLQKIYDKAKAESLSVALPRIGCGRARADWGRIKGIIKKVFHDHPVTIYWIPDRYSKK